MTNYSHTFAPDATPADGPETPSVEDLDLTPDGSPTHPPYSRIPIASSTPETARHQTAEAKSGLDQVPGASFIN